MSKVIVIVGPTAIGKTKISIELAKKFNMEIISGDSVAVYKKLDIGSAKPTIEERQGITHHLIDVLDPSEQYSVSDFQKKAREIIDKKKNIIICGGTGLYIQSVLFDYKFDALKRDDNIEQKYEHLSNDELFDYLLSLDKSIDTEKIHKNNRKRVLRAIEVYLDTNKSVHEITNKKEVYDAFIVYLNVSDREVLYQRINKRVDNMINDGLLDEVKELYDNKVFPNAIGYKELVPYFDREITLETAIEEIKKNSRHLAKRQMTWFKNQMDTNFYEVNLNDIDETINTIEKDIKEYLEK